jgi:prephenate dehydrogenase
MKVAVLGAAGKMGKWLVQYLSNQGNILTVSDINQEGLRALSQSYHVKIAKDNLEAVRNAKLTIVSVPIDKTAEVLREIAPRLKRKSIVAEITSVKAGIIKVLKEISKFDVQPLSLHPLFGSLKKSGENKFALIPVLNSKSELRIAKKIFPNANFHVINAKEHDKIMAATLSLPYFINMVLASTLSNEDFETLTKFGGTTYTLQLILIGSIMAQDGDLHFSFYKVNKNSLRYLKEFLLNVKRIIDIIKNGNTEEFMNFYKGLNNRLSRSLDLNALYNRMYVALEALEKP